MLNSQFELTCDCLNFFKQLRRNDRIVDGVDEDHRLVDAVDVVDARHLAVHLIQGIVAKKAPEMKPNALNSESLSEKSPKISQGK